MASSPTSLHDRFKCFGRNRLLHKYGLYLMFDDEGYQLGNVAKSWLTEGRQSLEPFYFYPISLTEIGESIVSGNKNLALFRDAADLSPCIVVQRVQLLLVVGQVLLNISFPRGLPFDQLICNGCHGLFPEEYIKPDMGVNTSGIFWRSEEHTSELQSRPHL